MLTSLSAACSRVVVAVEAVFASASCACKPATSAAAACARCSAASVAAVLSDRYFWTRQRSSTRRERVSRLRHDIVQRAAVRTDGYCTEITARALPTLPVEARNSAPKTRSRKIPRPYLSLNRAGEGRRHTRVLDTCIGCNSAHSAARRDTQRQSPVLDNSHTGNAAIGPRSMGAKFVFRVETVLPTRSVQNRWREAAQRRQRVRVPETAVPQTCRTDPTSYRHRA